MDCRKRIKAKLHTVGGFSLAELMLTMFILSLMTGLMAQGIPVVINVYQRAVDTANAETYLNTTMIALRGRLCISRPILDDTGTPILNDDGEIEYEHPQTGYYYFRSDSDKGIQIVQYLDIDRSQELEQLLAPSEKGQFVSSYENIQYNDNFFTITGLKVEKLDKDGNKVELAKLDAPYVIHTVNP